MKRLLIFMTILASAILAVILDFHLNRPDMSSYEKVRINWQASEARLFDRNGLLIHEMRVNKNIRKLEWVELEDISEAMKKIVISSEDRRFYQHSGVDWVSVTGSILKGARRGASTITMQTASFIDSGSAGNRSRRGPIRKWRQMKAAAALEETWTKEQILEAYLNLAGYRGELAGIGAASAGMFMKEPSGLNTEEASVLCALLKGNRADHAVVAERAVRIARSSGLSCDIERIRIFTLQTLSRTYNKIKPEIMLAPHVAGMLMKNGTMSVKCTLDKHIQETALLALDRRLYELEGRNVSDGAVIVIDNASGDILAYVGSSGSRSSARHVDGVKAKRQAGSTLKPFLYELAIEKKILTPASLLEDSPLKITTPAGVYEPDNYSNEYHGIVSVRTALASSLNIPAVRALGLVGQEAFVERLRALGLSTVRDDPEYYGYSLALGSADVTLYELANAYRTLANGGVASPLRLVPDHPFREHQKVMDENAAYIITDILSDRQARSMTFGLENVLATPVASAVKTGTSKDMRDNWCIGFTGRYTVGVWVGNFSGEPMYNVSGVSGAAPVWMDIMSYLNTIADIPEPKIPEGIVYKDIRFSNKEEPDRKDMFIEGTEPAGKISVNTTQTRPEIIYPMDGAVLAVDPDIPQNSQKVLFKARSAGRLKWKLNGKAIGTNNMVLWKPEPGQYTLSLHDWKNIEYHKIHFVVR